MRKAICLPVVLLVVLTMSCKKTAFYAYDATTLIISADKTMLKISGDKAQVTVVGVTEEGGAVHDHTAVMFTATLGTIPATAEFMEGRATVEFVSGSQNGIAEIAARSGNNTSDTLEITIGSAALTILRINAVPAELGPSGGYSQITVYAFDSSSNPLPGIQVILTTTSGKLSGGDSIRLTDKNGMISDSLYTKEDATVTAQSGNQSKDVKITVKTNELPTAKLFINPTSADVDETVYFDGSLSSDKDGSIMSWDWYFGDGSTGKGRTTTHSYDKKGTYKIILKVTDNDGDSNTNSDNATIQIGTSGTNMPPTAKFTISLETAMVGETVFFNGGPSTDADGSIASWEWDFGDGKTARGQTASNAYNAAGTYTITLKVTDDDGDSDTSTGSIIITK